MEMKMKTTELKKPIKKYEPKPFKKYEPMPYKPIPMAQHKTSKKTQLPKPLEENPRRISGAALRRADTTTMEKYKNQGKPASSTTTTAPPPRMKKAEGPSFFERAKSGLKSLMPQPGKLAYNEESFEPEKKMVGKAQRGVKSYLKGSMGKGGM